MQKTSKLDAVNTMLSAIGRRPVSSVEEPTSGDVSLALQVLDESSREIQQRGWHFNTVTTDVVPDAATNKILLPEATLTVDAEDSTIQVSQRGDYLYDDANETYEFSGTLRLQFIFGRDWEELPQPARTYIMAQATRKFVARVKGEGEMRNPSLDEMSAKADLETADSYTGDLNIFSNWAHYRVIGRNSAFPRGHL